MQQGQGQRVVVRLVLLELERQELAPEQVQRSRRLGDLAQGHRGRQSWSKTQGEGQGCSCRSRQ